MYIVCLDLTLTLSIFTISFMFIFSNVKEQQKNMKTTDKTTPIIGVLNKAKAKVCKMYARDDFPVLCRGFMITSLYDGHGTTTTLNSSFSSTGKLLRRGNGLTTYLNHEGKALSILQIHQGVWMIKLRLRPFWLVTNLSGTVLR